LIVVPGRHNRATGIKATISGSGNDVKDFD
jgi:hypothetical protein